MELLNEGKSMETDTRNASPSFPIISIKESQFLLVYSATENLHNNGLRADIVTFLQDNKADNIESFTTTAIYFTKNLQHGSITELENLQKLFISEVQSIEKSKGGKVFWFLQLIASQNMEKTKRIARAGQGNISFNERFKASIPEG